MNRVICAAAVTAALVFAPIASAAKQPLNGVPLAAFGTTGTTPDIAGTPTTILPPVDISGRESPGLDCSADPSLRPTLTVAVGANGVVTGLGWDVVLETVGPSWASEATMVFGSQSTRNQISLRVGSDLDDPTPPGGEQFESGGIIDLTDAGVPNIQLDADGLLYIGFCEDYVDDEGAVDANYRTPSTLTVACSNCTPAAPSISLSTTALAFGDVQVGNTSAPQSVTLSNTGTAQGVVEPATVAAPFSRSGGSCAASGNITLAAGANCTLEYSFAPTQAQASNQTLSFGGDGSALTLALSGTGTAAPVPVVGISVTAHNFGDVQVGNTGTPVVLTLNNSGTAAGSIVPPAVSAPFSRSGGSCATSGTITLAAGASCTLEYSFAPAQAQSFSQTLSFGGDGAGITISLSGVGITGAPPAVPRPAVVPVDSPWALTLLGLVMAGLAVFSLRQRS